jgi:hypothetical protein
VRSMRVRQNIFLITLSCSSLKCPVLLLRRLLTGPRRTLSLPGRPCPSVASWAALRRLASALSDVTRQGVTGFAYFCRNKSGSPAGAKPGNTEHHVETRNRGQVCRGKFRAQVWGSSPQAKASRSRWDRWRQKSVHNKFDSIHFVALRRISRISSSTLEPC